MIPPTKRRTFIKGLPLGLAGLALASPLWDRLIRRAMAQEATQQRLIVYFVPDGIVPEWFWADEPGPLTIRTDRTTDLSGQDFNTAVPDADRPTFIIQPLADYASRMLLIKGISNPGEGDHGLSIQSCLTGEASAKGNSGTSPSLDVLMSEANLTDNHAEAILRTGVYGPGTSLSTAMDLTRLRGESAFIKPSWQLTSDARRVLDGVTAAPVEGGAVNYGAMTRLAMFGSIKSRIEEMRCVAGTQAGLRLEAYVEEVVRLEGLEQEQRELTPFEPTLDPNDPLVEEAQTDISRLPDTAPYLQELAVTALALDYSPAVTIQWGGTGINKISGNHLTDNRYEFLPDLEYPGAGEHGLAHPEDAAFQEAGHNITAAVSTRDRVRIRRWYMENLKQMLDRLSSIPDGAGSLFDSTSVLFLSEFGGPNANSRAAQHSNQNLPYMLIAGSQTPFNTGQYMDVDRTHGDYLLTLARGFGSQEETMGVGTDVIDGILR